MTNIPVTNKVAFQGYQMIGDALDEFLSELNKRKSSDNSGLLISGISSGIPDLDRITHGLQPGSITVIASRPAMGKRTLVQNIALHVAKNEALPTLFFSMGMSSKVVASNIMGMIAHIPLNKLRHGDSTEIDSSKILSASSEIKNINFAIDDTAGISVDELSKKAIDFFYDSHEQIGLIVIDSIQQMGKSNYDVGESENYAQTLKQLKKLSVEIETPIIIISSLNRNPESRDDHRPILTDIPDKVIFDYSDVFIFLYREDRYSCEVENPGVIELIVGRNRFGSTGTTYLSTSDLGKG